MDRIALSTTFNGQPLLDGSLSNVALQVGSQANEIIDLEIQGFSASSLGGASGDIVGEEVGGADPIATMNTFTGAANLGLTVNDIQLSTLAAVTTVDEMLASINSDLDGKGARASTLVSVEAPAGGSGVLAGGNTLTLALRDGNDSVQSYVLSGTSSLKELSDKINAETIIDSKIDDEGKLVLSAVNAESITVTDASGASGLTTGATTNFSLVFTDTGSEKNGVTFVTDAVTANVNLLGINTQDAEGNIQGVAVTGTSTNTIQRGDLLINGVEVPAFTETGTAATTVDAAISAINQVSDETGVVAYEVGGATTTIGLRSTRGTEISIEYGGSAVAAEVLAATGLQERNAASGGGSVAGIAIDTAAGAQAAINVIDLALEQINSTRSDLGAINNRLDFTMSNLANVSEKTSAARSRILDADYAAESSMLSRAQVLQQASQAMLAQANAQPQQVLQLLQG